MLGRGYPHRQLFIWQQGNLIEPLDDIWSEGGGINNSGDVAGMFDHFGLGKAVVVSAAGDVNDLGKRSQEFAYNRDINDAGTVVGYTGSSRDITTLQAYVRRAGQDFVDLPSLGGDGTLAMAINNSQPEQVVGFSRTAAGLFHAFIWNEQDGIQDLDAALESQSFAMAVNDAGQVAGWIGEPPTNALAEKFGTWNEEYWSYFGVQANGRAFVWDGDNGFTTIGFTDNDQTPLNSLAYDINNAGQVVGYAETSPGNIKAFIYENGKTTVLNSLLPADSAWNLQVATAINDKGEIVGYGIHDGKERAFLFTELGAFPMTDFEVIQTQPQSVTVGAEIPYSVTLKNKGPDGDNVVFTNTFLDNVDIIALPSQCDGVSPVITCEDINLAPGQQIQLDFTVKSQHWGKLVNDLNIHTTVYDISGADNTLTAEVEVRRANPAPDQTRYLLTDLGRIGEAGINTLSLNDGSWLTAPRYDRGVFIYQGGSIKWSGLPQGLAQLTDLNDHRQLTGNVQSNGLNLAVLFDQNNYVELGTLGGQESESHGINNAGHVVGRAHGLNGAFRGFWYDGTQMIDIGHLGGGTSNAMDINDQSRLTGYSTITLGDITQHAFVYRPNAAEGERLVDIGTLGGRSSFGYAINNLGHVVGESDTPGNNTRHAFVYANNTMTDIDALVDSSSRALDINDAGTIVGDTESTASEKHAFVYSGDEIQLLEDLLLVQTDMALKTAYAVNENGDIAVAAERDGNMHGVILHPVTVPVVITTRDKFQALSGMANEQFGASVALQGDTLAVGVPNDGGGTNAKGAVYIFHWDVDHWEQQQKLFPLSPQNWQKFGNAVALDNDVLVIGAKDHDIDSGTTTLGDTGAAYVFTRDTDGVWQQVQVLTADDTAVRDRFGFQVAVDGDYIAVSTPYKTVENSPSVGTVYVFERNGSSWSLIHQFTPPVFSSHEEFGYAMGISGTTLAVGAPGSNEKYRDGGIVYLYDLAATTATPSHTLYPADLDGDDRFGRAVAIDGNTLVAGASLYDGINANEGAVFVFENQNGDWYQHALVQPENTFQSDLFGAQVALHDDFLAVGIPNDDEQVEDSGAVYLFQRDGNIWLQQTKIKAEPLTVPNQFGTAMAMHGGRLALGDSQDDTLGQDAGAVYVHTIRSLSTADLRLTVTPDHDRVAFAQTLHYEVTVENLSQSDAGDNPRLQFELPVWATLEQAPANCQTASSRMTCPLDELPPGEIRKLNLALAFDWHHVDIQPNLQTAFTLLTDSFDPLKTNNVAEVNSIIEVPRIEFTRPRTTDPNDPNDVLPLDSDALTLLIDTPNWSMEPGQKQFRWYLNGELIGSNFSNQPITVNQDQLVDGVNTVEVRLYLNDTQPAGFQKSASFRIKKPVETPAIEIFHPRHGETYIKQSGAQFVIAFDITNWQDANGKVHYQVSIDDVPLRNERFDQILPIQLDRLTPNAEQPFSTGEHKLNIQLYDSFGNPQTTEKTIRFEIKNSTANNNTTSGNGTLGVIFIIFMLIVFRIHKAYNPRRFY